MPDTHHRTFCRQRLSKQLFRFNQSGEGTVSSGGFCGMKISEFSLQSFPLIQIIAHDAYDSLISQSICLSVCLPPCLPACLSLKNGQQLCIFPRSACGEFQVFINQKSGSCGATKDSLARWSHTRRRSLFKLVFRKCFENKR